MERWEIAGEGEQMKGQKPGGASKGHVQGYHKVGVADKPLRGCGNDRTMR